MKKIALALLAATFVVVPVFTMGSSENAFPDPEKTITIVVPHAAGGSTDLIFHALVSRRAG